jgi:hypothetical protein
VTRVEALLAGVEVAEVAPGHADRADREADRTRIQQVEVDQPLERLAQWRGVVVADRRQRPRRLERGGRSARREEAGDAEQHRDRRVGLVEDIARAVDALSEWRQRRRPRKRRDALPELAQPLDPPLGRVAGDERGIDRADRDAGDPVGGVVHRRERLEHAGLVGAQRAAALQDEDALVPARRCARAFFTGRLLAWMETPRCQCR